jgi:hypothetical protein
VLERRFEVAVVASVLLLAGCGSSHTTTPVNRSPGQIRKCWSGSATAYAHSEADKQASGLATKPTSAQKAHLVAVNYKRLNDIAATYSRTGKVKSGEATPHINPSLSEWLAATTHSCGRLPS